ncbi:hypothetical protein B0I72DRAFT_164439 [Yarrowia lipolytica]|nr:hypothetical protein B0I72DRAFT_164439 [Yarrowia lipolytica]
MSSLLPIVKEVVKILFARSLYCVLFATEMFAADLNLPTRTAFARCLKRDAVRRGLDKTGTVFIMVSGEVTPENYLKDMMLARSLSQGLEDLLTNLKKKKYTDCDQFMPFSLEIDLKQLVLFKFILEQGFKV